MLLLVLFDMSQGGIVNHYYHKSFLLSARITLNVMTLKVSSNQVSTVEGVPISVTGIAQVKSILFYLPCPPSSYTVLHILSIFTHFFALPQYLTQNLWLNSITGA